MLYFVMMNDPFEDHEADSDWYELSLDQVFSRLKSSHEGLKNDEAERRQVKFGFNEIIGKGQTAWWNLLFDQFRNVLIIVLLIATGLSAILGHSIEALAIAIIIFFAILLGFIQNFRAEKAIERLRHLAAPNANVRRDGELKSIPARDLVPGDLIFLSAGDRVPADLRLLDAIQLRIDESPLTGESVPVEKSVAPLKQKGLALGDQSNIAFSGTNVACGRGRGIVVSIGMKSQFGKIATLLDSIDTSPTPLQKNLDIVGKRLAQAAFYIVALIGTLGIIRGEALLDTIVFAIALAVAVVPEALPAVVTISLAIGVQHLIKRGALIRRLPAVETLGATSVICSDKTGTLTRDEMTLRRFSVGKRQYEAGTILEVCKDHNHHNHHKVHKVRDDHKVHNETFDDDHDEMEKDILKNLLLAGTLSSDATLRFLEKGSCEIVGDPTEGAIVIAAKNAGLERKKLDRDFPRVSEIPFSSETKRMITVHQDGGRFRVFAKGAPEAILPICDLQKVGNDILKMDQERRDQTLQMAREMAADALRVLAIAEKRMEANADIDRNIDRGLTLLGLIGMMDPPRSEVKESIRVCHEAGIKVVMITGDHPITADAIAKELNITKGEKMIDGTTLAELDDDQLSDRVEAIDVYARVSPAQKLRIVSALQEKNHITAMTGDGVNDAPALKKADLGIAMGITGTDVSKEAADMTLTDDNFVSIVGAIEEGRGIYANIQKYLAYLLSANIGEIGLIAAASAIGLPMPLTAVQILYVNLATDGLPALALALDPHEADQMKRKPRDSQKGIFTKPLVGLMALGGIWSAIINLCIYIGAREMKYEQGHAMTLTFVSLVLIQFLKAYNFRSIDKSIFRKPFANKWLNLAIIWEIALLLLVVHWSPLQSPFGTIDLSFTEWLFVLGLSASIVPVLEIAKFIIIKK